jgi:hypothetical protein
MQFRSSAQLRHHCYWWFGDNLKKSHHPAPSGPCLEKETTGLGQSFVDAIRDGEPVAKVARDLKKHVSTLYRWNQRGVRGHKLPIRHCGGSAVIIPAELEQFLRLINDPSTVTAGVPAAESMSGKVAAELDRIGI